MKIETEMTGVKDTLVRVEAMLISWNEHYPNRGEVNEKFKLRDEKIAGLQTAIEGIRTDRINERTEKSRGRASWPSWLQAIVALLMLIAIISPHIWR